jgi:hypothetical protein
VHGGPGLPTKPVQGPSDHLLAMPLSPTSLRRTATIAALALSALGASTASASASVLWTANAERPWNQEWANYSCQDASRVQEIDDAAQGSHAYRISVQDGDDSYGERCELGQANPTRANFPLFHEGDERWISYQMRLGDDVNTAPDSWFVVMQLKQLGGLGTPAVSMGINRDKLILMNSDTNHDSSGCNWWWQGPAYKNRWLKFTYHIKFSPDDSVGYIELYGDMGDGQGMHQLMARTYMHTQKVGFDGKTVDSHSRIGIYRDTDVFQGTSHIDYDGYTVGTDRDSVEAAAYGDGSTWVPPSPGTTQPPKPPTPNPGTDTRAGNGSGSGTGSKTPPAKHSKKKARVWLKLKRGGLLGAAARTPWGRILPVYGGVSSATAGGKRRAVVIEIRSHGRWEWLTRGWMRSDGRFYLSPAIDTGKPRVVKLRAVVKGVGHSKTLRTRIR